MIKWIIQVFYSSHKPSMSLPLPLNTSDRFSNQSPAALTLSPQASSIVPLSRQQLKQKMKAKMTKDEIRRKIEKVLKSGKYKMKVGRLIFWDFGGQYVYYTTHQTFMTYRALFLVVFDGSKGLREQVPDVLCFPGQPMTPTPADFLQHWDNCILTYCKAVYTGIPKIVFVATHKDKLPKDISLQTLEKDIEQASEIYLNVKPSPRIHQQEASSRVITYQPTTFAYPHPPAPLQPQAATNKKTVVFVHPDLYSYKQPPPSPPAGSQQIYQCQEAVPLRNCTRKGGWT
ncbi:Hypothetical predicted protein [Mytilus galloprovincialis]|uniref:Roc domain-containing protein n=1 Tax=Mytilus galloprovincialis TaxID=29158 RepID=A0A8B6EPQ5_MYTGA|nr:Hypothetical predicted protein [Mytilus galloprovincialis]